MVTHMTMMVTGCKEKMVPLAPRPICIERGVFMNWQKWVGTLAPWVLSGVGLVLGLLGIEPAWWGAVAAALLGIIQRIMAGL